MATDLQRQLEASLGGAYRVERELGGGGMSRVFVATETALGRKVVIKVLPPDFAGELSADRFRREVLVAAQLQHPHIVPLLSAGEMDGVPYFTMPFVEGESLRIRLNRDGELPVRAAVKILRDVASALAYAHRHGVVHRDIKPDNVLLEGDSRSTHAGDALVADFGVAKALTAAAASSLASLTSTGIALGTPAYMAPEQVAADPSVDQRADVYAFGCLAYEMLTGEPPFHGRTVQQIYAAHLTGAPDAIERRRQSVPPALARLVMRCLEKRPADRPQHGGELLEQLDALTASAATDATGAGEMLGTAPTLRAQHSATAAPSHVLRSFGAYVIAFAGVAGAAWLAVRRLDVPGWVFPGAVIVMLLGAPVLAATALLHRAKGGPSLLGWLPARWLTWRRTAIGGVFAVSVFATVVAAYVVLRALGVGPVGSLAAAGVVRAREPILVADFGSPPNDSSLGTVVSEALRTDLTQSASLTVVQPAQVRDVLVRMQRAAAPRLDLALAREVAEREGIRIILDGDVRAAGSRFVVSGRLVSVDSGRVLAAFRETADDANAIIPAVDRLSKKLRGRVGESLRAVRESPPIEKVTTPSLEALRRYATATRAADLDNDFAKAQALLGEAIALDSGFAMAWRKLGIVLGNTRGPRSRVEEAMTRAYLHRDRLTEVERFLATAAYHTEVTHDTEQAIAAYEALIDLQPNNDIALNNVAILHERQRSFARALELYRRAAAVDSTSPFQLTNMAGVQGTLGDTGGAIRTLAEAARRFPGNPEVAFAEMRQATTLGRYEMALAKLDTIARNRPTDLVWRTRVAVFRASIATTHGRLTEAQRYDRERAAVLRQRGVRAADLIEALDAAWYDVWFRGERARGVARLERALAEHPMDSLPVPDRPYVRVIEVFAEAGAADRAKRTLAAMERVLRPSALADMEGAPDALRGRIALAEGRPQEAVDAFRRSDQGPCTLCALPNLGRAYDLAGNADSAIAIFERYIAATGPDRSFWDRNYLAGALKRLGELYEARGDRERAGSRYARFVELWKDADPELQPKVAEVRRRLRALGGVDAGPPR
jgi:tetratricopeptide (TPR) repeat protein/tRNA A-37 threonylcarbamoyl transferase component Bud32